MSIKIKKTGMAALIVVAAITSVSLSTTGNAGGISSYVKPYAGALGRCVTQAVRLCKSSGEYSDPKKCSSRRKMQRFYRECEKMGRREKMKMK